MCFKYRLSCFGFLITAFFSLAQAAEPLLNGVAIQAELGKEQFIGALYSNLLSDNIDVLTNGAQSMRMELKITMPEGMTTRRFSRMWIEGMAINNSPELLTAEAGNMVKFDGLFKGRLLQNDNIVFNYEQKKGVNVSVNNVLLGNIPSDNFFAMLLRTWAGKVPPSTDFKNGILKSGKVSAELKSRYENIKPTKERSAEIAAWSKSKSVVDVADTKKEPSIKSSNAFSSASSTPIVASNTQVPVSNTSVIVSKTDAGKTQTTKPDATKPDVSKTEPAKTDVAKTDATKTDVAKTNAIKADAAKNEVAKKDVAKKEGAKKESSKTAAPKPEQVKPAAPTTPEEEEEQPALTVQTLLARQFYISELMKKIRSNARYPKRSLARNEEGSIRITVTIDRKGNVMSTSMIEASPYELLNEAAQGLIAKAIPLPPMPDTVPGSSLVFTVPITFALPK